MTTNVLILDATASGNINKLEGDMSVSLNLSASTLDNTFNITFLTRDANSFDINSTSLPILAVDGSQANKLTVGGKRGLDFTLRYNDHLQCLEVAENNLVSLTSNSSNSGGGGSVGGTITPTSTTGNRPEALLVADANGVITPDGSISNRFRFVMTANTKLADPINFSNNEHIYFTAYQDGVGNHTLTFALSYMLPGAQPFVAPQAANAAFLMEMRPTLNPVALKLTWAMWGYPDNKTSTTGFGLVTEIAKINGATYYAIRDGFAQLTNGNTMVVLRNGLSAEATGTLTGNAGESYYLYGSPVPGNGADQRPVLQLLQVDFGQGGANRPAYGKALLNFEGSGDVYIRDIHVTGARNVDSDARGICPNAIGINLHLNNVKISNCNNGILSGNQGMIGNTYMNDVVIDACGVGGPTSDATHGYSTVGFTHSVYFGHNNARVEMNRVSLINAVDGDNLKCRTGTLIINQVLCTGSSNGRELEVPNGGWVEATNCTFWKQNQSGTGNMVMLGGNGGALNTQEGLDTSRPRKYKFTNCLFRSDYVLSGRDGMLICHLDPDVPLEFIDCKFEGPAASNNSDDPNGQAIYAGTVTVNGIRYLPSNPPVFTLTGGPVGPILPVGYQDVAMTPI